MKFHALPGPTTSPSLAMSPCRSEAPACSLRFCTVPWCFRVDQCWPMLTNGSNGNGKCPENGNGKPGVFKQCVPSMAFYALLNNQCVLNPKFGQGHKCGVWCFSHQPVCHVFLPKDSKGSMRRQMDRPSKLLMSSHKLIYITKFNHSFPGDL